MAAHVLTAAEQKAALSGKKKKKKTVKNILGIPDILKVECRTVGSSEAAKLQEILERLLPSARLLLKQNAEPLKDSTKKIVEDSQLREKAKNKRDQLCLGVNAVNKSIKKNAVSAVLLANDIQPKLLLSHLYLLCDHHKIPFLCISGLKKTTTAALGFPCIAVGFKTDSCDFSEAVAEINSLFKASKVISEEKKQETELGTCKVALENENGETDVDSSESDVEMSENTIHTQSDGTPFTYLFRKSVTERMFVPEICGGNLSEKQRKADFISVESSKDSNETDFNEDRPLLGISSNAIRKQQLKAKNLQNITEEVHDNEGSEVPKKKRRKKEKATLSGTKQNPKYCPAKLFKVPSNPNRDAKKKK